MNKTRNYTVEVEVDRLIEKNWETLLKGLKGKRRDKVGLALHWLRENFIKLYYNYRDIEAVEKSLFKLPEEKMGEELHFLQILFVDRIEGFHQQVYATLSTLIAVLNHTGIKGIDSKDHPINSVKGFLEYLSKKFPYRGGLKDQITILEKSRDYRSKFIDHLQQHILHEWMTFGYNGEYYVIYFRSKGDEVYSIRGDIDPMSPDFRPPVNCGDDFYISPDKKKTYKALVGLTKTLLGLK